MKNQFARTIVPLFLAVFWLGLTAYAQREEVIKATIPFEFSLGGRTFPPGNYRLVSTRPAFLQLCDATGKTLATVLTNQVQSSQPPNSPRLEFKPEGGAYTLVQVWQGNHATGQQLGREKTSSKVARQRPARTQTVAARDPQ
ncbi:MAG: hypothetical protein ACRD3H_15525 [Terriglobales bacterium]